MGYNTKIDWCDSSWNPVTGCEHGCKYCYARGIAKRFSGFDYDPTGDSVTLINPLDKIPCHEVDCMLFRTNNNGYTKAASYPFGFEPTLHRYRLDQPSKWSEPRTIFVCSMADLFGDWVPDEWIEAVINACLAAPQHRYLFLTKNPVRYLHLFKNGIVDDKQPNFWFGSTVTNPKMPFLFSTCANTFVSIEPILAPFHAVETEMDSVSKASDWIIVGAETGNRKNKVVPKKEWVMELVKQANLSGTPLFMKESLRDLMGDDFKQEFPWEV